jgi:2-oxoglutarate dehydrogenase complex dehydrogenase (E1) component-like enzyme
VLRRQALSEAKKPLEPAQEGRASGAEPGQVLPGTLAKAREDKPIALVRVEQPYPFPAKELQGVLGKWKDAEVVWAQDVPKNMGSWPFMERELPKLGLQPKAVTREESASHATGSLTLHQKETTDLMSPVFDS